MIFTKNAWAQDIEQKPREEQDELGKKFVSIIDEKLYEVYFNLASIPSEWWLRLWELYEISLNVEGSIQEQRTYTVQTFFEALIDPEYYKTLILQDKQPAGLMLGVTNLEKTRVNYVNPDHIRKIYPEAAANNRVLYITIVFFSPELRSVGFFDWFITLVAQTINQTCDVFIGEASKPRVFIKDAIRFGAERAGIFLEEEIIGVQTYFAFTRSHATRD